jgi:hypothetical protein
VDGTHSRIPSLGADPEVFLLIRAALDRLNLRVKPADAVLEGGVLAARDPLLMECISPLWFSICTCRPTGCGSNASPACRRSGRVSLS